MISRPSYYGAMSWESPARGFAVSRCENGDGGWGEEEAV